MCLFAGDKDSFATSPTLKSCRRLIWHSALTRNVIDCEKQREGERFLCSIRHFLPFRGNWQIGVNNDL